MIRTEHHAQGPRLYVRAFGRELRIHHGPPGLLMLTAGILTRHANVALAGLVVALDDLSDFPWKVHER